MKLHERTMRCQKAESDLRGVLLNWLEAHDLTWAEVIRCLAHILSSWTKYPVREERHPDDPDKGADEA